MPRVPSPPWRPQRKPWRPQRKRLSAPLRSLPGNRGEATEFGPDFTLVAIPIGFHGMDDLLAHFHKDRRARRQAPPRQAERPSVGGEITHLQARGAYHHAEDMILTQ